MSNPEQRGEKPVSEPETEENVPAREGTDEAENDATTKGSPVVGIVTLVAVIAAAVLLYLYFF